MAAGTCPDCGSPIAIDAARQRGDRISCPACGADLQVSALSPVELDWAIDDPDDEVKLDFEAEEDRPKT
jgi:lysine biosynthesis protein LysW